MADKNDSGDRTEPATPRRLQEARKKGDVAKSKDFTSTGVLLGWMVLGSLLTVSTLSRLGGLFDQIFVLMGQPFAQAYPAAGWAAAKVFVMISASFLLPIALFGSLVEFLQVGAVFTLEKMTPKLDHMNPGEGLKRMVNTDNLFEAAKSLGKTALLGVLTWLVISGQFQQILALPGGEPQAAMSAFASVAKRLLGWTLVVFVLVSLMDSAYQRFSFAKKMKMSRRDIRQEAKDSEGDPHVRAHRRQLHQEWAQQNAVAATRGAAALVVNPTHIACAIAYDPTEHAVPVLAGKGEGLIAQSMREAAEEEGVPIVRNVELARALRDRVAVESIIPEDMFAAVAEVILWARRAREEAQKAKPKPEEAGQAPSPLAQLPRSRRDDRRGDGADANG